MNAVKVTLDNMLGAISDVPEIGQLASGAKSLMDTGYSLWTAWDSVANPQTSIKNSLHNDLVKLQVSARATVRRMPCCACCCQVLATMLAAAGTDTMLPQHAPQDYLVCEMTSIVSQAESDIIKDISDTALHQFNAVFDGTVSTLNDQCGALNCLNATDLPPSQRNSAVNYPGCVSAAEAQQRQHVRVEIGASRTGCNTACASHQRGATKLLTCMPFWCRRRRGVHQTSAKTSNRGMHRRSHAAPPVTAAGT